MRRLMLSVGAAVPFVSLARGRRAARPRRTGAHHLSDPARGIRTRRRVRRRRRLRLVALGRQQARLVAERLKAMPISFTSIQASTMTRARQTGEIIADRFPELELAMHRDIRECTPTTRREDIMADMEPGEADECEATLDGGLGAASSCRPSGDRRIRHRRLPRQRDPLVRDAGAGRRPRGLAADEHRQLQPDGGAGARRRFQEADLVRRQRAHPLVDDDLSGSRGGAVGWSEFRNQLKKRYLCKFSLAVFAICSYVEIYLKSLSRRKENERRFLCSRPTRRHGSRLPSPFIAGRGAGPGVRRFMVRRRSWDVICTGIRDVSSINQYAPKGTGFFQDKDR